MHADQTGRYYGLPGDDELDKSELVDTMFVSEGNTRLPMII